MLQHLKSTKLVGNIVIKGFKPLCVFVLMNISNIINRLWFGTAFEIMNRRLVLILFVQTGFRIVVQVAPFGAITEIKWAISSKGVKKGAVWSYLNLTLDILKR